ncbi:MAG: glycosyltransferase family 25 protein [Cardiobacteriaceae bacterium]|nr:glycosyltransferase family 25 protein [Cardiobacteriaceae bacterium]
MKVLILNLDQSHERLKHQIQQAQALGLDWERLPAVSVSDIDDETYRRLALSWQRPLKTTELACFLSHKKAWELVKKRNQPMLILEDDAVLAYDIAEILQEFHNLTEVDFINLETYNRHKILTRTPSQILKNHRYQLYRLGIDRSGAAGYVLYPRGARKLLDYLHQRPIGLADEFINDCEALYAFQIEPAAVIQSNLCEHFGIIPPAVHQSIIYHLAPKRPAPQSALAFWAYKYRRIKAQIYLFIKRLKYPTYIKRPIQVRPEDFKPLPPEV